MNAARLAAEMNAARLAAEMNAAPHCRRDVGRSGDERSSHCRRDVSRSGDECATFCMWTGGRGLDWQSHRLQFHRLQYPAPWHRLQPRLTILPVIFVFHAFHVIHIAVKRRQAERRAAIAIEH